MISQCVYSVLMFAVFTTQKHHLQCVAFLPACRFGLHLSVCWLTYEIGPLQARPLITHLNFGYMATHRLTRSEADWRWQESLVITIDHSQQPAPVQLPPWLSVFLSHTSTAVHSAAVTLRYLQFSSVFSPFLSLSCGIRSVWWPGRPPRRPAARRPPETPFPVGYRPVWSEASCLSSTPSNRRDPSQSCRSNGSEPVRASQHSSRSPRKHHRFAAKTPSPSQTLTAVERGGVSSGFYFCFFFWKQILSVSQSSSC